MAPYIYMVLFLVLVVVLIGILFFVRKIYIQMKNKDRNDESQHSTLVKILQLLAAKQKGCKPPLPCGPAEGPQEPVVVACGSCQWRCSESQAGTKVSLLGDKDVVLDTFQVPLQPVEEVIWALRRL